MKTSPTQAIWRQILSLLPVYLNVFMVGCTFGWPANAIYFMNKGDEVSATLAESALIVSSTEIGRITAAIPGGLLVDKFGRKKIIKATVILHFTGWSALSINSSFVTLCIARFVIGIAMAFVNATTMISIGELASPNMRAKFIAIYQQSLWFGYMFQMVISVLFSSYFTLSYCTLAICSINFLMLYWALETPNFLISISQNEKAMKNLRYVRSGYSVDEIQSEFDNMKNYIEEERKRKSDIKYSKFLKSKEIATPLITAILINFFVMASGLIVINTYIIIIIPDYEFISKQYYPSVVFSSSMVISLVLPWYIERFPRRIIYMIGAIGMSMCYLVLAISYFCYSQFENQIGKGVFSIGVIVALVIISGSTLPMMNLIRAEILPQSVKGLGNSFCVVSQSVANIIIIQFFEYVLENFNLAYNFIVYATNSLILFFIIYHLVPESRGKFLSDIQLEINEKVDKNTNQAS